MINIYTFDLEPQGKIIVSAAFADGARSVAEKEVEKMNKAGHDVALNNVKITKMELNKIIHSDSK